jgi:glycosyltransferase involved in cell wall biosynthesis
MSAGPMRVLMVSASYLPEMGGTETHMREVSSRLAKTGDFEITVLAADRTRSRPRVEVIDGITVLRVPAWPSNRDYYLAPRIASVVGYRGTWDLVHCQGVHTPVSVLAMRAAARARTPYMVTFHSGGHTLPHRNALRSLQWRVIGPLLRKAASLVAVSRFEADSLSAQAHLGGRPVTVIPNGGTMPPPAPGTRSIPGRIVSAGRLERYKGHHRLIEALPHVIRGHADAHLVILGGGSYEAELRNFARRHGVAERVTIRRLPTAEREAMATAMAEASVVAAMSDYESQGITVLEALSLGRPVVGCDVAAISELVAEGLVRGVAPKASPTALARQLLEAMSAPAPAALPQLPTWDTSAEELRQLYLSSAGRTPAARRP